jgi:hypothetical protein
MLLKYQDYINEEILDELNIDYKKINGVIRLISNNIYYLNYCLEVANNNYINYDLGLKATKDLTFQVKNYQDRYFTFLAFDLNEILVVDGNKFLLIPKQTHKLEIMDYNVNVKGVKDFLVNHAFIPPEIRELKSHLINISANYYSIGYILLKIIFNDISPKNIEKIKYTTLYYFIKRCIHENPQHRFLVLV